MKELLLLRHAKSSWGSLTEDRNRSLSEKGIERIKAVAIASFEVFKDFEVIYTSPANRAMHTASILTHQLKLPFDVLNIRETLYTFEISKLLTFIKYLPDHYSKVICIGHNPAFTQAVNHLSPIKLNHLPTSAWALIQFEQNKWKNVHNGKTCLGLPKKILK